MRDGPSTLGLAALAGIAPCAALNTGCSPTRLFRAFFWLSCSCLETPWATAPLTLVLGDLMFGVRPRPGRVVEDPARLACPRSSLTQLVVRGLLLSWSSWLSVCAVAVRVPRTK